VGCAGVFAGGGGGGEEVREPGIDGLAIDDGRDDTIHSGRVMRAEGREQGESHCAKAAGGASREWPARRGDHKVRDREQANRQLFTRQANAAKRTSDPYRLLPPKSGCNKANRGQCRGKQRSPALCSVVLKSLAAGYPRGVEYSTVSRGRRWRVVRRALKCAIDRTPPAFCLPHLLPCRRVPPPLTAWRLA
jgi:hypothetical protein